MNAEHLDARWVDDYKKWSSFPNSVTSKLRTQNASEKKEVFIKSGLSENPTLKPSVDFIKIDNHEIELTKLVNNIGEKEEEQVVKDAYIPRINELLINLEMLKASGNGDTDTFIRSNVDSYDEPHERIFNATLDYFHSYIDEQLSNSGHPAVREAARQAKAYLPEPEFVENIWPNEKEFSDVKSLYDNFYDEILDGIILPSKFGNDIANQATEKALQNLDLNYEVVPQGKGVNTMAVNHSKKQVKIPEQEKYDRERFIGLLGHEIRVHIEERINGDQQPLKLLYSGLRRYLKGSEGKGVLTEQTVYPSMQDFQDTRRYFDIARRYLSIGLARGTDSNEPRDFKEVFQILNSIDLLSEIEAEPNDLQVANTKAINRTWELLAMRTLRGWTGRGAAALKDKIYLEGNLDQWKILTNSPDIFPYLNKGKYDASNPGHISILKKIGTIPTELTIN